MNKDEQNKAIAEACGWHQAAEDAERNAWWYPGDIWAVRDKLSWTEFCRHKRHAPPDYCNSLDAMAEAEKACIIGNHQLWDGDETVEGYYRRNVSAFASAEARSERFLKALNLWHPAPPRTDDL